MTRRAKIIGVAVALLAIASFLFSWPLYKKYRIRAASSALRARTEKVVEMNPQLRPDWDKAMEDGVLTWTEANEILEKVGQKADPEE
jgi:hypothetical protein